MPLDVNSELIQKYNTNFNNIYNLYLNTDETIKNKESIILKENEIIEYKNKWIELLSKIIFLLIGFGILLIGNILGLLNKTTIIILSIIIVLVFLYNVYYIYSSYYALKGYINSLAVNMANYVNSPLLSNDGMYHCPSNCTATVEKEQAVNTLNSYGSPTLNTDSQVNVWKYGDIPNTLYTSPQTPGSDFYNTKTPIPNYRTSIGEKDILPNQQFSSEYPLSTYYECQFMGSNNGGLPNKETEKYSTIPCNYRENTVELNKYWCKKDPNKNENGGIAGSNCTKL